MKNLKITNLSDKDVNSVNELYNKYISETAFTFDIKEKTYEEKKEWANSFSKDSPYQCLVTYDDNNLIGFVSSRPFREKEAYFSSVETSVYIDENYIGNGYGKMLLEELFKRIDRFGVSRAYAFITKPNEMSEKLHHSIGFNHVGTLNKVGKKFEKYWDVGVFELYLPIKWLLL